MSGRLALALLVHVVGCAAGPKQQSPSPPPQTSELRETAMAAIRSEADRQRQELVKQELDRHAEKELVFSAARLAPHDRQLLAKLLEAADVVEELNLLQGNARMLEYREQVQKDGTDDDRRLFFRNHGPWCLDSRDVRCCALRSAPLKSIGMLAWPEGFVGAELSKVAAAPNARVLLSPFTLVRRDGAGGYRAVLPVQDPLLGPRIKQLSDLLRQAAGLARDPTLKTFLAARARALLSSEAFPFDDSDLSWIALGGQWEVTVGPYEVYRNPYRVKARFGMYIGLQDEAVTQRLAEYGAQLQGMENALSRLVGRRVYRPRRIDSRTAIRAIHLVRAAGDARRSAGAVVAYHLPNVGKGPELGLTKKVILINHLEAMHELDQARARLALDPSLVDLVRPEAAIEHITLHEFCHGFGAYPAMKIESGGKETTVGEALSEHSLVLEEVKADALALWLIEQLRGPARVERQAQHERYATAVARLIGLLQMDLEQPHTRAAAVVLGTLVKEKAATYDAATGRWQLDFQRFSRALAKLARQAATIQFEGDREGAARLVEEFVTGRLVEHLAVARARGAKAFADAGIKQVTFRYRTTDLAVSAAEEAAARSEAAAADEAAAPDEKARAATPVDKARAKATPADKANKAKAATPDKKARGK